VVPYTRGAEYSRPAVDVIAEARRLVDHGAKEITLLGQNVNAYHGSSPGGDAEWGLGRLIRALAEIDGLARIRYTTSHPRDMDQDLITAHGEVASLMPYLHLPVQSGSDAVLAAMNRRHRVIDYIKIIDRLRQSRPDIALSSDFIVGYPGETDADFAATLELVRQVGFAQAYSFKYSPRPGTPAADARDQVPDKIKSTRLAILRDALDAQQLAHNRATEGRIVPVLFERAGRRARQAAGRTPWMQAVHVDHVEEEAARRLAGKIVPVEILSARANSLSGRVDA
jgi:tRNA-2-methylthio-N6-dimethylallyladenosine synthase